MKEIPNFIKIAIVFWLIIGSCYLLHTKHDERSHDFAGHLHNTRIIVNEKRLPKPYDFAVPGGESYQPPLYYLICSVIYPEEFNSNIDTHINAVRIASLIFGAIVIYFMGILIHKFSSNSLGNLLILTFISSTPKFAFIFTTYNNDSLATLLNTIIVYLSYDLFKYWDKNKAVFLFLITTASFYTKATCLYCLIPILILCFISLIKQKNKTAIGIITIVFLSLLSYTPWLYFHNYKLTNKFFPTNFESELKEPITVEKIKTLLGITFRISSIQKNKPDYSSEWKKPWAYPTWQNAPLETKRYDYFAFLFITSIIGEYVFSTPSEQFIYFLFTIHFLILTLTLINSKSFNLQRQFLLVCIIFQIYTLLPFINTLPHRNMDYRYVGFLWIILASIYSEALNISKSKFKSLLYGLFCIGILLNLHVLETVEGGFWW